MKRGVFWVIECKLLAFPFDESATAGIAKSGNTYNHKLLWEHIKSCNKPFYYYPRGRVDVNSKGESVIYLSPHIEQKNIAAIKTAFGIETVPLLRYDFSEHYRCYLDR
ncbi:MAG: hypothetical protein IKE65_02025 [Clostridia bacterium]|nr:hypothetical protein [Clostridia bacterium]